MSSEDENVFSRWSRRKQATRHSEPLPRDESDDTPSGQSAAVNIEQPRLSGDADPEEAAEPLPRLEDLTAESDLSSFFRKEVPKAVRNAAMRKMWSLNPAIRNYVGPAEYAWDFNQPGSMAGFGPTSAKESITNIMSAMSGAKKVHPTEESSPPLAPTPLEQPVASPPPEVDAVDVPETEADTPPPPLPDAAPATVNTVSDPDQATPSQAMAQPRHGRALPR